MNPKATALLREIACLADSTGHVGELSLLDSCDGSTEALGELLDVLEEAGHVTREASDRVRITPAGIAAAGSVKVLDAGDGYPPG